jgi:hypothetical protein
MSEPSLSDAESAGMLNLIKEFNNVRTFPFIVPDILGERTAKKG